jgi:hypothetical protein
LKKGLAALEKAGKEQAVTNARKPTTTRPVVQNRQEQPTQAVIAATAPASSSSGVRSSIHSCLSNNVKFETLF